jgi:hypothetical protein
MASVPIVRYYDHLRFVYEVKSKVRQLRGEAGSERNGEPGRNETEPVTPGETKQNPGQSPGRNDGGSRTDPRQEDRDLGTQGPRDRGQKRHVNPEMEPANGEFVETSLHMKAVQHNRRQSGSSAMRAWERSRVWIA